MERRCKKCGESKDLADFPVADKKRGYWRYECKVCFKKRHAGYYSEKTEEYKARANGCYERWGKKAYADLRSEILDILGRSCRCCGETEIMFLAIDHVDNDGNVERQAHGQGYRGLKRIKSEIDAGNGDRFQTLCFNCNQGKKLNGGICPHKEGSTTIPAGGVGPSGPKRAAPYGVMI